MAPHCSVAVICGEHVLGQVYPASVPIDVFFDDLVELVVGELRRLGGAIPDPVAGYELQRVNGVRLDITQTLDDLGVRDGGTLVLTAASVGEAFEPQCESLSTGLAGAGKKLFPPVTERTATRTAVAVLAMAAAAVLGLAWSQRVAGESSVAALVVGGYGSALAVGAGSVWRWFPDRRELMTGLGWVSTPLLAFGCAAAAPGGLGSPHLLIAAIAGMALTGLMVGVRCCHGAVPTLVGTLCLIAGIVGAARTWRPVSVSEAGLGALVGLLFLLAGAPTLALWIARVRPPHFGSVTGRDLFNRQDGMPASAVSPVDGGADDDGWADPTPSGARIAAAAVRANGVLTGLCLAAAAALPVAVWATLVPGRPRNGAAVVLGSLFVLIFISRARSLADCRQAVALVCGGAAALCAVVVRYVSSEPAGAALLHGTLVLVGFGAAGLAAALLVPVTAFTPLVRLVIEWLELAAIAAALPLAAWVGDLFTWVRLR